MRRCSVVRAALGWQAEACPTYAAQPPGNGQTPGPSDARIGRRKRLPHLLGVAPVVAGADVHHHGHGQLADASISCFTMRETASSSSGGH
jgi:hypothetical protein